MCYNVPDDWGMYYRQCSYCGATYHESEGGCSCYEEQREKRCEELIQRIKSTSFKIDLIEFERATYAMEDELGCNINKGDSYVRLYIEDKAGVDELLLNDDSWEEIKDLVPHSED